MHQIVDGNDSVWQMGPWYVDVRHQHDDRAELQRYIDYAKRADTSTCDCIYSQKVSSGTAIGKHGWFSNATIIRLPTGGCLVYSPVLDDADSLDKVKRALVAHDLLPVRFVIAPSPQHYLALRLFQREYPKAMYFCGAGSSQMTSLREKRKELRFDRLLSAHKEVQHVQRAIVGKTERRY